MFNAPRPGSWSLPPHPANDADQSPLQRKGGGDKFGPMDPWQASVEKRLDRLGDGLESVKVGMATLTEKVGNLPTKDDLHKLSGSITKRLVALLVVIAALVAFADKIQAIVN